MDLPVQYALFWHRVADDPSRRITVHDPSGICTTTSLQRPPRVRTVLADGRPPRAVLTVEPLTLAWRPRAPEAIEVLTADLTGSWWAHPFGGANYMEPMPGAGLKHLACELAAEGRERANAPGVLALSPSPEVPWVFFSEDWPGLVRGRRPGRGPRRRPARPRGPDPPAELARAPGQPGARLPHH